MVMATVSLGGKRRCLINGMPTFTGSVRKLGGKGPRSFQTPTTPELLAYPSPMITKSWRI
jgi:hypothetical protein